ncbi:hypothetical protein BGW80DRAFT_846441 [Lactifluus volemus]|nr:hypothetical protein BGW80DRAFT_846441 [Lactifluus volemus]
MNYDIFRDELGLKHPAYGHALWEPDPGGLYNSVEVGDVGFIRGGRFHRLFNALLPRNHPFQNFGVPEHYERLELHIQQHICTSILNPNDIYSKGIKVESGGLGLLASGPEPAQVAFSCFRKQGAILSLPVPAQCADTIALGDFAKWIVKHIDVWFAFAQNLGLGLSRMEEIVFVTGRHLARSSINVVFSESQGGEQVAYGVTTDTSGANLEWQLSREDIRGVVFNCGPSGQNLLENQCIFVRGFRVTRFMKILPRLRGAASPTQDPDGPEPEFEIQLIRIPANTNVKPSICHHPIFV